MEETILKVSDLSYSYGSETLRFPDFACDSKSHLLISGNSGVGKTTLLHLLSGIRHVQKGSVEILGSKLEGMSQSELDRFRGENLGIIFQQPGFIKSLTAMENLLAAQYFGGKGGDRKKAEALLEELGIPEKANEKTQALSGGERQRLAIARALACNPAILLADEPTSSLDDDNAQIVYELLVSEADRNNALLVVVSHDQRLKSKFTNRVSL